ncbi:MAG: methyltransferase domain-containing protein [Kangiella sp.]|nr:methyltransferase domain-containing protein [Kangiella sp.]
MNGFTRYALKNLKSTGSIAPSSRFLAKKIAKTIPPTAKTLIELGAGDGVITRHLLATMNDEAKLTAYELSDQLLPLLQGIKHPGFSINNHSALELTNDFEPGSVDFLLSCLPIALFDEKMKRDLLQQIHQVLSPNGLFVQYQYLPKDRRLIMEYFPETKSKWIALNIPPSFIYIAKPAK